jgi:hypothetical protein
MAEFSKILLDSVTISTFFGTHKTGHCQETHIFEIFPDLTSQLAILPRRVCGILAF